MNQDIVITAIVFVSVTSVLFPLVRAWSKRIENRGAAPQAVPADVTNRLDRIERAVESVAVEVERISEGQRFVTKLLAERSESARQLQR